MNKSLATDWDIDMSIVGMLSQQERQYLCEYTKNEYSGIGAIVDLGCWLGSSTILMAIGLVENPNPQTENKQIQADDLIMYRFRAY
jgi:predicted O-methyltransferase YrrM